MGAYLQLVTPGDPAARRVDLLGPVRDPELQRRVHGRVHEHDADGRLPRRRPARGDVRDRADDGRARRRARHGPARASPQELHQGVPAHARLGPHDRLRRLRRVARQAARAARPRRDPRRAGEAARERRRRSSSASASRPTTRCAVSRRRGSSARSATPPAAGSRRRSAACRPARCRSSPAPRRTGRVTRPPGRRSSPTSSAATSTRSRCSTATRRSRTIGLDTYGSRSLPGRRRRALLRGREGDREGAPDRRPPAGGRRPTTSSSRTARSRSRARPTRRRRSRRSPGRRSRRTTCPTGWSPALEATAVYDPPNFSWPAGAHAAVVEVDTETGDARLVRYVAVDDVGTVVNPIIVDGQVHGGITQGIAAALYEEGAYDEDGNLQTANLVTYLVPSAAELPVVRARPRRRAGARRTRSA